MRKICFVLTSPFVLNAFLRPHLERLVGSYDITVCLHPAASDVAPVIPAGVRLVPIALHREIRLIADIRALFFLTTFFRREEFDLVFSMTPKAGLLAMMSAWIARVHCRVHCFTGQVWAGRRGSARVFLKMLDRVLARCASRLLADSPSQMDFLITQGIVSRERIRVLASGSMAGVDTVRFSPDQLEARRKVRASLKLPDDACCLLYVGRLKVEKGVVDLQHAFSALLSTYPSLHLLLVGPDEDNLASELDKIRNTHRVHYSLAVEEYMAAGDIFCLPSYREGFGAVLIEAGAVGLPVVASRIYGITDAVVEDETGLLHRPGNVGEIVQKISILIEQPALRRKLGDAGRRRAEEFFARDRLTEAMEEFLHCAMIGNAR